MTDDRDSYLFAIAMMRLRALIRGERFPVEEDDGAFDLVMAAALVNPRAPLRENDQ